MSDLPATRSVDVAIIGGGIAGLSLAYFLAARRRVAVIERESAVGYHSTGRSAAEFSSLFLPPPMRALTAISETFLAAPPLRFAETPLLSPRGNVVIAAGEKVGKLRSIFDEEHRLQPSLRMLEKEEALARAPILDAERLGAAFFDPECRDMDVAAILQGYARGARAQGADIVMAGEIVSARRDASGWVVETTAGDVRAPLIVNAAGGWADGVARLCGIDPLGIVPHRRTAIIVNAPGGIDVAALPEISEVDDEFYMKPDAGRLLVSPADETPSEACDAQAEEIDVATAVWRLEQATTVRVASVAHRWAGLRSFAPDRLPVVGFSGQAEGFFWLAGQGGCGILTSPALGRLAAELVADGRASSIFQDSGVEPERFSPRRLEGARENRA